MDEQQDTATAREAFEEALEHSDWFECEVPSWANGLGNTVAIQNARTLETWAFVDVNAAHSFLCEEEGWGEPD